MNKPEPPISGWKNNVLRKYSADDLFFFAFYTSVGFAPPIVTLLSSKALQLPLIIISIFIYLRLLVRPAVLTRFAGSLRAPSTLLLLALFFLISIYALPSVYTDVEQMRILLKPGLFLLVLTVLRYANSNGCEIDSRRLWQYLKAGILISIILIIAVTIWSKSALVLYLDSEFGFIRVHKINRALEVVSVLVFLFAAGTSRRPSTTVVTFLLALTIYVLSYYVVGSAFWSGVWHPAVHVTSETVQFGLPIAITVFVIAQIFPRAMTTLVFGGIGLIMATAPWLYQYLLQILSSLVDTSSFVGLKRLLIRAEIWDAVGKKITESPFWGAGIDSARYQGSIIIETANSTMQTIQHPHNMILQIWLDLGLPGILIIGGLIFYAWRYVRKLPPASLPPVLAGITMMLLYAIVSHSIWQTWIISLLAIFITLVASMHYETGENTL